LFGLEIALDLEFSEIDEQRALLIREPIGFALQRNQPGVCAACLAFRARAVARLRAHNRETCDEHRTRR